jgi:hypothetical protein
VGRAIRLLNGRTGGRYLCRTVASAVLFTVLTVGSCSVSNSVGDDGIALASATALAQMRSYLEVIGTAEQTLVNKCAAEQGFDIHPTDPQPIPDPDEARTMPPPPPETARSVGYGLAPKVLNAQDADASKQWAQTSQTYKEKLGQAVLGSPAQHVSVSFADGYTTNVGSAGCYADVRRTLWGDLQQYASLSWISSQADGRTTVAVLASVDWSSTLRRWSSCMASAGFRGLSRPGDARALVLARVAAIGRGSRSLPDRYSTVLDYEQTVATSDSTCAQSSRMADAWTAAVAHSDTDYLVENHDSILAWAAEVQRVAAFATQRALSAVSR